VGYWLFTFGQRPGIKSERPACILVFEVKPICYFYYGTSATRMQDAPLTIGLPNPMIA